MDEYKNYIKNECQTKIDSLEIPSEETDMTCIRKIGFSWIVQIRNKDEPRISKTFKKLEDAINFRDRTLKEIEEDEIKKIYNLPITYTEEGIPYIGLKNKDSIIKCLVDEDKWHFYKTKSLTFDGTYVRIKINDKLSQFNRYIYETFVEDIKSDVIDHINRNKLDNRIQNLRDTTYSVNSYNRTFNKNNTSGYRGVYKKKDSKTYSISITFKGEVERKYGYDTPEEAALAYNELAIKYYGDKAILNTIKFYLNIHLYII